MAIWVTTQDFSYGLTSLKCLMILTKKLFTNRILKIWGIPWKEKKALFWQKPVNLIYKHIKKPDLIYNNYSILKEKKHKTLIFLDTKSC